MFKRNRLVIAVLAAMASPMAANAVPLTVDVNGLGAGGVINNVTAFDWAQSNIIAVGANSGAAGVGGNQAIANFINGGGADVSFQVLGHGRLGVFTDHTGDDLGLGTSYNWTFEMGFGERVSGVLGTLAAFEFADNADAGGVAGAGAAFKNFFNIYYNPDPADSNDLDGEFFNNAAGSAAGTQLVYSGKFTGTTTNGGAAPVTGNFTVDDPNGGALDGFGAASGVWATGGAGGGAVQTVQGHGSNSSLALEALYINQDFIKSDTFISDLLANVSQNTPFTSLNPSTAFNLDGENTAGAAGFVSGNVTTTWTNVGTFNGQLTFTGNGTAVASGSAFQFQTDFNQAVDVPASVPAPASIALFGAGLGLLGAWRRRRYNAA